MRGEAMIRRVGRRMARWRRAGMGARVVVAVSGGGDSLALLRLLHEVASRVGLGLAVAHLDHGVRGEAGRSDAEFVAGVAAGLGLPFEGGRWEPTRAGHFEADARRARYAWLVEVARRRGAGMIAVGHTRDDQAETVLHRILRGTGPRGLAGIPARRRLAAGVVLVRPLLDVEREDLRAYLREIGQEVREDATNADLRRTRSRIRHDLLPKLAAEYNPRVAEALVRLGRLSGRAEGAVRRYAAELARAATIRAGGDEVVVSRPALLEESGFMRAEMLRHAWREAGWPERGMSERRWRRLAALAGRPGRRVSIGAGIDAMADAATVRLVRMGCRPAGGCD